MAIKEIDVTSFIVKPIKCADCGQFIAYADIDAGLCKFEFEPDSHFGPEVADWSCCRCSDGDIDR
jgi:hypothetical protein